MCDAPVIKVLAVVRGCNRTFPFSFQRASCSLKYTQLFICLFLYIYNRQINCRRLFSAEGQRLWSKAPTCLGCSRALTVGYGSVIPSSLLIVLSSSRLSVLKHLHVSTGQLLKYNQQFHWHGNAMRILKLDQFQKEEKQRCHDITILEILLDFLSIAC